jgi:hypothetical protein
VGSKPRCSVLRSSQRPQLDHARLYPIIGPNPILICMIQNFGKRNEKFVHKGTDGIDEKESQISQGRQTHDDKLTTRI